MGIIKKQSLQSSIYIYLGFLVGAINILFLFPKWLTPEQFGLTRVLFATSATITCLSILGVNKIMLKFYPFYNSHLKKENSDFLFLSFLFPILGFIFFSFLILLFKEQLFNIYSKKSPLFIEYFYFMFPGAISLLLFNILETYSQNLLRSVLPNILKELSYRIFVSLVILLYVFNLFDFKWFMILFISYYFLASIIMLVFIYQSGHLKFSYTISKLSYRLKNKMIRYGIFMFGGSVLSILAENVDTLMIAGISGLENTAVFSIAGYMAVILRVPQRSIVGIVTPIISKAWKEKNLALINKIYKASSINLMIASSVVFILIWINIDLIYSFLPEVYSKGKNIVLIMSLSVIIDLSAGVNGEILFTSNSWKVFFYTHLLLLALSIPTNYFLINHFGIIGSAFSNLIAFTGYNACRYLYIKKKYGLDPFSISTLKCLLICLGSYFITNHLNLFDQPIISSIFKSAVIVILLFSSMIFFKVSDDLNFAFNKFLKQNIPRLK